MDEKSTSADVYTWTTCSLDEEYVSGRTCGECDHCPLPWHDFDMKYDGNTHAWCDFHETYVCPCFKACEDYRRRPYHE